MKLFTTFFFLFPLVVAHRHPCPLRLPTPLDPTVRIHGGLPSPAMPYIAALFRNSKFECTASTISPTILLTAAHCVPPIDSIASQYYVRIGGSKVDEGERIGVKGFARHPKFQFRMENDVGLVFLTSAVTNVYLLPILTNVGLPSISTYVRLVGFGGTSFYTPADGQLRRADIPVTSCSDLPRVVDETNLACAGGKGNRHCVSCKGDSGAPWLEYDVEGKPVLVGLHSGGTACGSYQSVSVFVRGGVVSRWLTERGVGFVAKSGVNEVLVAETRKKKGKHKRRR